MHDNSVDGGLSWLSRRRAQILLELVSSLRQLEAAENDRALLRGIQERLISLMCRGEAIVRRERTHNRELRSNLHVGRPSKDLSRKLRRAIARSDARIVEHQHWLYVIRCVGDGIAYLYLPTLDLRHFSRSQPTGFISRKEGAALERRLWRSVFKRTTAGAILCDLTNCLRMGDICFLHDEGQYSLSEVKQPNGGTNGAPAGRASGRLP